MRTIIFGTTNPAKIAQVKGALAGLSVDIKGIDDYKNLPKIVEDGKTAQENARKKAVIFAKATDQTVFSMDNALYLDGLGEAAQPGINVRRIQGFNGRPTDQQLIDYYSNLINQYGGEMTGYWEFAIAIAGPVGVLKEVVIKTSTRYFRSKPSQNITAGYPLESLQVDGKTGKYISDMNQREQDTFWQESIGKELRQLFIKLFEDD